MYSTDLAPSDYHLFLHIKKFLVGQRLKCYQDTKNVLQDWLKGLAAKFVWRRYKTAGPTLTKAL